MNKVSGRMIGIGIPISAFAERLCLTPMISCIEPDRPDHDGRTFDCAYRGHAEVAVVKYRPRSLCLLLIVVVRFGLNTFPKLFRVGTELLLQLVEECSEPVGDGHPRAFLWVDGFHGAARSIQVTGAA
jgi:hypothetical protein